MIDPMSTDARAKMYSNMIAAAQEQTRKDKTAAMMADLKARGIIKDRTPAEIAAAEKARAEAGDDSVPWLLIGGIIFGVLALMGGMGALIIYIITKYFECVPLLSHGKPC